MNYKRYLIVLCLLLLVILSSVVVAYSVYLTRQNIAQVSVLTKERDALEVEWEQLLLELNTFGGYSSIEKKAYKQLEMQQPSAEQLRVIKLK